MSSNFATKNDQSLELKCLSVDKVQ